MVTHCKCKVVPLLRSFLEISDIISPVLVVKKLDVFKVTISTFLLWLGVNALLLYTIYSHMRDSLSDVKRFL